MYTYSVLILISCSLIKLTSSIKNFQSSPISKKSNNLEGLKNLLKIEIVEKCTFESNPVLVHLCPHYHELMSVNNEKNETVDDGSKFYTFNDIESVLINKGVVQELRDKCGTISKGWCLNTTFEISTDLFLNYGKSLCLVSSCYDELKEYVYKCADSEVTKYLLDILPLLCKIYLEDMVQNYCVDEAFKVIHIVYAHYTKKMNKIRDFNICKVSKDKTCNEDCQEILRQLNRFKSCCYNTDLLKDFKAFTWYFEGTHSIPCNVPLKTTCWNDEQIAMEASNTIYMYIFIACMFVFFILMSFLLWFCHEKEAVEDNSCEYSKLKGEHSEDDDNVQLKTSEEINDYLIDENFKRTLDTALDESVVNKN